MFLTDRMELDNARSITLLLHASALASANEDRHQIMLELWKAIVRERELADAMIMPANFVAH